MRSKLDSLSSSIDGGLYSKTRRLSQLIGTGRRRIVILGSSCFLLILLVGAFNRERYRESLIEVPEYIPPEPETPTTSRISDFGHGGDPSYPPTWEKMNKWQDELPQHNLSLPYPEGSTGRYVYFSNQVRYSGWNNVFNEMLLNTHLAYESKRAYVFIDYWWNHEHNMWHKDRSKWPDPTAENWDPITPLNAIISGPTSGMPWDTGDDAPRSVHFNYWQKACPPEEIHIMSTGEVKPRVNGETGIRIFEEWAKVLREHPARCIQIKGAEDDAFGQVFDLWLWGSDRVVSLFEPFTKSPTSRLLKASPIVSSAVQRNEYLFHPHGPKYTGKVSRDPYDHMMAMHVRRGDFTDHCLHLARWNSTFYSWNILPYLPDRFYGPPPPPGGQEFGTNTPENIAAFMRHCLPLKDDIVKKARDARADFVRAGKEKGIDRVLDVMYLLTNDRTEWIEELKAQLKADGWNIVRTTSDLELDQVQIDVGMSIDMEIARRAAVFVGNGWSSYTSNINQRRLADGRESLAIRFW